MLERARKCEGSVSNVKECNVRKYEGTRALRQRPLRFEPCVRLCDPPLTTPSLQFLPEASPSGSEDSSTQTGAFGPNKYSLVHRYPGTTALRGPLPSPATVVGTNTGRDPCHNREQLHLVPPQQRKAVSPFRVYVANGYVPLMN